MASSNSADVVVQRILKALSDFGAGRFSGELETSDDSTLGPIISGLNLLGRDFAQARSILEHTSLKLEKALAESEKNAQAFREIFESVPVGIIKLDPDLRFLTANPTFCELVGYSERELQELTLLQLTHPDDIEASVVGKKRALRTQSIERHEKRYLNKSGNSVWARVSTISVKSKAQGEHYLLSVVENRTETRAREEEIRLILDALQIGVWKFNPTDHSLHWDASMYKLYDMDEGSFSSHYSAWESSLTPEARAKAVDELGQALRGEKEFNTTFEIQTKSGGKRYVAARAEVIRNAAGEPIRMLGINYDVTAQKQVELEARSVSKLLDVVLSNIPSMVFVKDATKDLRFVMLNKAGEKLLGKEQAEFLGKTDFDLFDESQAEFFTRKDKEVFIKGTVLKIDKEEIDTPTGRVLLSTFKVPTFNSDGTPHLLIGISNDITKEVRDRALLELERSKSVQNAKLASLGEMSAGIAHEINNPLAIILSAVRLIPGCREDSEKLQARVEMIEKAANRVAKIVGALKKFSRTSDKSDYRVQSLRPIVEEALLLTRPKSQRHSTFVEFDCKTEISIFCSEIEIEQTLINLINNGIDAVRCLSEKWVKITLFENDGFAVIQVRDSGKGIPSDIQPRLFQPFFTTKPMGKGTGLGLSIVKGILDDHNAEIDVLKSDANTCFEIRFPRAEATKNAT